MTLVGVCSSATEIVKAIEVCDENCIKLEGRGYAGTTAQAFVPGDQVYHGPTAESFKVIMDRFQWFLGPFGIAPLQDNEGQALRNGHIYWDTTLNTMFVYNGSEWTLFTPLLASSIMEVFTWVLDATHTGGTPLQYGTQGSNDEIYGRVPSDWDSSQHSLKVTLNGSHLVEETDAGILLGDFTVDYDNNTITPKQNLQAGDVIVAMVMVWTDQASNDFINRAETDASGYGFVVDEDDMVSDSDTVLATQQSIKAYADGKVAWMGAYNGASSYAINDMVSDSGSFGSVIGIANQAISPGDRPAVQAFSKPSPGATHTDSWSAVANDVSYLNNWTNEAQSGAYIWMSNIYTIDSPGFATNYHICDLDPSFVNIWQVKIYKASASGEQFIQQFASGSRDAGGAVWWDVSGSLWFEPGNELKIELYIEAPYNQTGAYGQSEASKWNGWVQGTGPGGNGNADWFSAVEGSQEYIAAFGDNTLTRTDVSTVDKMYGVDVYFWPTTAKSTSWDLIELGAGSTGGSTQGFAGGTNHIYSNVAPTSGEGSSGDIWFTKL
jgi:hypothetical protein